MLKKAGIIVAASAASLLAASPMAFAGDYVDAQNHGDVKGHGHDDGHHGHDDGHHGHHGDRGGNQNSQGFVNGLNGNNVNVPIQICNNDVDGQVGLVPVQDIGENPTGIANGAAGLLFGQANAEQHSHVDNSRSCGGESGGAGYGNN